MENQNKIILMADVIGSREKNQSRLMTDFREVTTSVNIEHAQWFLSPLTITLGDEFQCIAKDIESALRVVYQIEENVITKGKDFKLKYVVFEGKIETPINEKIAYEMMGEGLTNARETLSKLKKGSSRFLVELNDKKLSDNLNLSFSIYQSIVDSWNINRDYCVVSEYLKTDDYKVVAEKLSRNRSLIWKREHNLKINQYKNIIKLTLNIIEISKCAKY